MEPKDLVNPVLSGVKNFSPFFSAAIASAHPGVAAALVAASAVLGFYGDYANEKTSDLLQSFMKHQDEILAEIVQSDKFKSAFIQIINDNITEGNEEKRQLLKNYIIGLACGVERNFNEHTKLISTLNDITLEEVRMLSLWRDDGEISNSRHVAAGVSLTIGDIEQILRKAGVYPREWEEPDPGNERRNQILLSLGYKGLLHIRSEDNFGSGQEVKVKGTTNFGIAFLHFILRDT